MASVAESPKDWSAFPAEIKLMVVNHLVRDGCELAPLATVSRQWQHIIERRNFQRIKLTPSRMHEFGPMTQRNRALVNYIWLSLELEEYDCSMCEGPLWNEPSSQDNLIIRKTIHNLFLQLSSWQPQGTLTLDISVHSPSDSQHCFKYLSFGPDSVDELQQFRPGQFEDRHHGWFVGTQCDVPPPAALEYLHREVMGGAVPVFFNEDYENAWWQTLPKVPVITNVLMRLQTRRRWRPTTIKGILSRFSNLQGFHYEPWRAWSQSSEAAIDEGNDSLFESLTANHADSLKSLVLFENFDEQYSSVFAGCEIMRTPKAWMARSIAKVSLRLQSLCASFIVEAEYFMGAAETEPEWNWPDLTSLTLTSRLLTAQSKPQDITDMLLCAASVAARMPNLQTFEIWNGQKGSAALFRYHAAKESSCASLGWRATWKSTLDPRAIQAWDTVARAHGRDAFFEDIHPSLTIPSVLLTYTEIVIDVLSNLLGLNAPDYKENTQYAFNCISAASHTYGNQERVAGAGKKNIKKEQHSRDTGKESQERSLTCKQLVIPDTFLSNLASAASPSSDEASQGNASHELSAHEQDTKLFWRDKDKDFRRNFFQLQDACRRFGLVMARIRFPSEK
ncbi:hypothetical protein GGR57DRAFT_506750 [Xylariaceae sp. FL1272]|nr:hypothetical protein GGR57DRAFT_506750 [Xylariaceae sp. FL1272]